MSSGASANALQRLVEQLKLEAAVERIKVLAPGTHAPVPPPAGRCLRQLQSFSSTVCRTPARMPCLWVFQLEVTRSVSPDPVLYSEDSGREVP
ncbi:guanine nucleotide-binding protein G(I)/G(S)/G(O) subunit gamma-10 isoform X2 [Callithrix jacchus]